MSSSIDRLMVLFCATAASPAEDLTLGRRYVVKADTPSHTSSLSRLADPSTSVQQILYLIFAPISLAISTILNLFCSLVPPITAVIDGLRTALLGNLINLVALLSLVLVQYAIPLLIIQFLLNVANDILSNATTIASAYGCTITSNVNTAIDSIFDAILGVF